MLCVLFIFNGVYVVFYVKGGFEIVVLIGIIFFVFSIKFKFIFFFRFRF